MNYGQLKQATAEWSHRSDLGDQMALFVSNVSQRLGERFGVMPAPLVDDTDTNSVLTTHPRLYLLGCQIEVSIYTHDAVAASAYEVILQEAISNMNVNYQDLDWAACPSPVITPYCDTITTELFPDD